MVAGNGGGTLFHNLGDFMAIPRVGSIKLSPDGTWLAATVQTISPDNKKYLTSIWRIDTAGGPPRRLTRSAEGEGGPVFLPDGSLLFTSRRPNPETTKDQSKDKNEPALWLLPAGGGEAQVLIALPGGVAAAATARDSGAIVVSSAVLPTSGQGATAGQSGTAGLSGTASEDERLRKERKDAGVSAILHESAPIRYWDHDLGPGQLRLFKVAGTETTDLTPRPGAALNEQSFQLTPDGGAVITGWWHRDPAADSYVELVAISTATGERTVLLSEPGQTFENPRISPDGRFAVCSRGTLPTADEPSDETLFLVDISPEGGAKARDLLPDLDRWPVDAAWAPDSRTVYFAADDNGRRQIFSVDVTTSERTQLTHGDHAYTNLEASADGRYLYALRMAVNEPPTPVRIDLRAPETQQETLQCPGVPLELPGTMTELETTVDDGERIRSWLVLPHGASADNKVPLLLWVHGGPHASWNSWAWRWNPWLMAAKGYAVLMPDPALSTGYGQHMLRRGYHAWGDRAYRDVMAATDAALAQHPELDATRTGMMGGSYGGYMANWIAGHTGRFKAIVSHASLWALDQMFTTTDEQMFWWGQFGDPLTNPAMFENNSPHLHIKNITTPMLVIHGDKDYRVPIGEALRLWGELTRHAVEAKFLYFPDENHWVLTPGNATVWYETVYAFLAQHVLGEPWERPRLL
jgi:dipeptidyl aminopeptidase/acylaminoacyl peptidase